MKDSDFKECWFIDSEMKFYSYKDFLRNAYAIKRLFDYTLQKNGKLFYKWFLYANIHLTMAQKNKAWDWLNNYCEYDDLKELVK